jgi:hypothetical protein
MKISVLTRVAEALKHPADLDLEVTEDLGNIVVSFKLPKDGTDVTKAVPQKRQPRIKGDKNILATFSTQTPMDGDGPQVLHLGKEKVETTNIRQGVLDLLEKCGIKPDMIAAYPESEGKKQIEGILAQK